MAVVRSMMRSNLVGWSTGICSGLAAVTPFARESLTPTALRNALRASILAIAGFAAKSKLSAPTGMIIVCDRAALGITDGEVDCAIGGARTSNHSFKSR